MARILVVDDSPTEMFRFKEILNKNGYTVLEATNGADGVTVKRLNTFPLSLSALKIRQLIVFGENVRVQATI
jgi:CheY-like chemotaxis protein